MRGAEIKVGEVTFVVGCPHFPNDIWVAMSEGEQLHCEICDAPPKQEPPEPDPAVGD